MTYSPPCKARAFFTGDLVLLPLDIQSFGSGNAEMLSTRTQVEGASRWDRTCRQGLLGSSRLGGTGRLLFSDRRRLAEETDGDACTVAIESSLETYET